jgi:hypothetical protein
MRQEEWGPQKPKAEETKGMRLEREAKEGASLEALRWEESTEDSRAKERPTVGREKIEKLE